MMGIILDIEVKKGLIIRGSGLRVIREAVREEKGTMYFNGPCEGCAIEEGEAQ
jgi:hypothetical protein